MGVRISARRPGTTRAGTELPSAAQVLDRVFHGRPLLAVLRGLPIDRTVALAEAVWDTGLGVVEVPLHAPSSRDALAAVARLGAERGEVVGAGGVLTPDLVPIAKAAGAAFTLAPGFDADVLRVSLAAGLPHLPGAATPTEIQRALRTGCRWFSIFPAAPLGPPWVRALHDAFPHVSLIATGGITPADAPAFRTAGARSLGVDAPLLTPDRLPDLAAALT
ncbi:bifunctional 4-hydroxy-2-oxoglutarate aldolase/2-dehydro-3-deoxy-phosphogluconate aldolase [Catenuloplanes atrovinosus]|uniref:2-dehydro-3-deoxyphosphogluconate aldolase/(4S)-4-hydroxy-2-oxoglutarate aldolase n=1 Tax=Catenuloplanes atrovinosus TaxID=137266 RepID=A0AAE3YSB1_9ACTN|nr:bifunctional 4-hydroxy-2-oxoglutarate aldolase/2-dehydro-3-deoxy-phosphogluconate aldolase [Catenuloplanes atrovinosus]MDR7277449.1 2-dehydro-3-deoxyphosphogluconate aldolase/(4S)-4-hydroxy-2-oxoglutarate aldolase [Catenuloplanes atrovinosus]